MCVWSVTSEDEVKSLSRVRLFVTPWTVAYLAPPSMGFSRQEYWSGRPFPSPGDLPDPGIEPGSPALRAAALTSEPPGVEDGGSGLCAETVHPTLLPEPEQHSCAHLARILPPFRWRESAASWGRAWPLEQKLRLSSI